jgi:hypothetical protein
LQQNWDLTKNFGQFTTTGANDTLNGIESLVGTAYNDSLTGNDQANILTGGLGNDTLNGLAGADTLVGGGGDDIYNFAIGGGADTVVEAAGAGGGVDTLAFSGAITHRDLWFSRTANTADLKVSVLGTTDSVTIDNWFSGAGEYAIEYFQAPNANRTLVNASVNQLVSAMAQFNGGLIPTNSMAVSTSPYLVSQINASWY